MQPDEKLEIVDNSFWRFPNVSWMSSRTRRYRMSTTSIATATRSALVTLNSHRAVNGAFLPSGSSTSFGDRDRYQDQVSDCPWSNASTATASNRPFAWGGASGHTMLGQVAAELLPDDMPAFLLGKNIPFLIGELSMEADRCKDAGRTHDWERDPATAIRAACEAGRPLTSCLFATRAEFSGRDYDTLIRELDPHAVSRRLPAFTIVDGFQQLRRTWPLARPRCCLKWRDRSGRRRWLRSARPPCDADYPRSRLLGALRPARFGAPPPQRPLSMPGRVPEPE